MCPNSAHGNTELGLHQWKCMIMLPLKPENARKHREAVSMQKVRNIIKLQVNTCFYLRFPAFAVFCTPPLPHLYLNIVILLHFPLNGTEVTIFHWIGGGQFLYLYFSMMGKEFQFRHPKSQLFSRSDTAYMRYRAKLPEQYPLLQTQMVAQIWPHTAHTLCEDAGRPT